MKNVLILGAGQSTPHLISYMLDNAEKYDWNVIVCDMNLELAKARIDNHPRGKAVEFDINNEDMRKSQIENSDIVINFLTPRFQHMVALDCLNYGKHCVTASYEDSKVADLNDDAVKKGILILNEMGLDPGIDHMSAMNIISKIKKDGGTIKSFISYGGALPAPEVKSNPLGYCMTWNPKNVAIAGKAGAQYMENQRVKLLAYHQLFQRTWAVEVDGIGTLEAYPNRDSLVYQHVFDLEKVDTMIRATLRNPGWSATWHQIVRLGMANEIMKIPNLAEKTYAEFTEMFIPLNASGTKIDTRIANFLNISPTGKIMDNLRWLGFFSNEKIGENFETAADVLTKVLKDKLPLPKGERDMVILVHEIECEYADENNRKEKIISTFVGYGENDVYTAISKTVGLPAAMAAKLILTGELQLTGTHIPTNPVIYTKVLEELKTVGINFKEKKEEL